MSGTQIINYAIYTTPDYPFPVPISSLIGQHLRLADGSEVFVASAIDGMEVYRNANGDGIPSATGENQILYYMYSNMSNSYKITPIQVVTENGINHYEWAFTYENVYAYLQNASSHLGLAARLKLDHLTLGYDFSVNGNVSNLKTSFDIGQANDIQTYDSVTGNYVNSAFSFDGLSLSLLYATATYASTTYQTYVNNQPYNSTTTPDSTIAASTAQIGVQNVTAYDYLFEGNYTLNQESNQTQQAIIESYQAKAEVASPASLPINVYGSSIQGIGFFTDELNLSELFGGSWPSINTNYNASPLIYRICFPAWNGQQITYDPLYVGHIAATTQIPELPPQAIAVIAVTFVATASIVLIVKYKNRKHSL